MKQGPIRKSCLGWIEFHRKLTRFSNKPLKACEPFEVNMTDKQFDACIRISEVFRFQSESGVHFQLKEQQVTAVKNLLLNHDVLAVLPTGYGKSLIFQSFVVAKELLENAKNCVMVICPLTSIIQDQIAEAKSLAITCCKVFNSNAKSPYTCNLIPVNMRPKHVTT